ncbi:hypothetical protein CAOG_03187 [Capsaspora owczarzaki ATCC 30864]|uniref:Uncharacterized protein n=1 Tax=Capsaspora owczarzaki (strain ATCC 30864) TaxID=595528 RepID=A0A0D2X295_CAPO3|nr:hypothetical protein CAOG_03187 [Capsaspora owczarzaki ATCC 30864]KJE92169.1 hypothetical protein CAOG_003187 [Capsaspora owczarzaki ATCC 30864]|eukprot:XP_004364026.1 hypothetical protein CAOG_03187 [Capsaspora owczarzaki ATCC 30864]
MTEVFKALRDGKEADALKLITKLASKKKTLTFADDHGWTPLHFAANSGFGEIVTLLSKNGASVQAKNNQGQTPLMLAAAKGHIDVCRKLVEAGSELLVTDNNGWSPKVTASKFDHKAIVTFLEGEERFAER